MAQFNTIRKDVEEYLESNWNVTKINFNNTRFKTPSTEFIRCRVLPAETLQISMGNSQDHRTQVLITVSVFGKINTGNGKILEYADTLVDLFTNKTIGVVNTRSPTVNDIGEEDGWYQVQVTVPAWSDRVV